MVQIEQDTLTVQSVTTMPLELRAVAVCDAFNFLGFMNCGTASKLSGLEGMLSKLAATSVQVKVTSDYVFEDRAAQILADYRHQDAEWWTRIVNWEKNLYLKETGGQQGSTYPVYFGMVRNNLPAPPTTAYSGLSHILSHEAAAQQSIPLSDAFPNANASIDITDSTVAHETGHTLGLRHTNTIAPQADNWPGCWVKALDSKTDWPWMTTDNHLYSSATTIEVGFDVYSGKAVNPVTNSANGVTDGPFELMSYCYPRWIAPQRATDQIPALTGAVTVGGRSHPESERTPARSVTAPQPFWIVTGSIPSSGPAETSGPAEIDPLFEYTIPGDTSGGSGAYAIQVQNSSGTALFTQRFDLPIVIPEAGDVDEQPDTQFVQTVPVTAGAARIVLLDPNSAILTYVNLGGVAPTVAITNPTATFDGSTPIAWTISDPDSTAFASRVSYSPDNGATWSEIGQVSNSGTSLNFDFSLLPGTNGKGLIKVLVSDGVNTGQAISPNFSIAKRKRHPLYKSLLLRRIPRNPLTTPCTSPAPLTTPTTAY